MPIYRIPTAIIELDFNIPMSKSVMITSDGTKSKSESTDTLMLKITTSAPNMSTLTVNSAAIVSEVKAKISATHPLQTTSEVSGGTEITTTSRVATKQQITDFIKSEVTAIISRYQQIAQDIRNGDEIGSQHHCPASPSETRFRR